MESRAGGVAYLAGQITSWIKEDWEKNCFSPLLDFPDTHKLGISDVTECGRGSQEVTLEDAVEADIHHHQHLHLLPCRQGPSPQADASREMYQLPVSPSEWRCDSLLASPKLSPAPPTGQEWLIWEDLATLSSATPSLSSWERVCPGDSMFPSALPWFKSHHERRPVWVQHCPWLGI